MQDAFDILVNDTNEELSRKETVPRFAKLHNVPKQVADSCQAVGVNERAMKNGLMSGVLKPSQKAHDRLLACGDALWDSMVYFWVALLCSMTFNYFTASVLMVLLIYIVFHIDWWEKGSQWKFVPTIEEYLSMTRTYYYAFLGVFTLLIPAVSYYYMKLYSLDDYIAKGLDMTVKFYSTIVDYLDILENKSTLVLESKINLSNEFEGSYNIIEHTTEAYDRINDSALLVSRELTIQTEPLHFALAILLIIITNAASKYFYDKYYRKLHDKNKISIDKELKSDLENIMDEMDILMK